MRRKTDYETDEINETDEKNQRDYFGNKVRIYVYRNILAQSTSGIFRLFRNLSSIIRFSSHKVDTCLDCKSQIVDS